MNFDFSKGVKTAPLPPSRPVGPPPGATLLSDPGAADVAWLKRPRTSDSFHLLNAASTSSGKTASIAFALVCLYLSGYIRFTIFDRKRDAIDYALGLLSLHGGASALSTFRYINVFSDRHHAGRIPLNLALANDPAPKELQAKALAHLVARTATAGDVLAASVGHRILNLLTLLFTAVLYVQHPRKSLLWAIDALEMPAEGIARLQALVPDERIRVQLQSVAHLPSDVKAGALARLRVLAAWPGIEAQLGAPTCTDFGWIVENFNTCVDLQSIHAGSDDVVQTFGSVLISCFGQALLRRQPRGDDVRVLYVDEALQFTSGLQAVARPLLETGRSRGAALWLSAQHLRGIRDMGSLYDSLVSNVAYRLFGAVSADDARVLAVEQFGSASDPRATAFIRHLVGLRQREFVLTTRDRISFFRSATLDFPAMAQARDEHADRVRAAAWALSAQELPAPVRLCDAGGPRPLATQAPLPPIQPRPTRRRSFLG